MNLVGLSLVLHILKIIIVNVQQMTRSTILSSIWWYGWKKQKRGYVRSYL